MSGVVVRPRLARLMLRERIEGRHLGRNGRHLLRRDEAELRMLQQAEHAV